MRKKRAKETIPRLRRTKSEIARDLTKQQAEAERETNALIKTLQKQHDEACGRKKKPTSAKTKEEILKTRRQKLRKFMREQANFADTNEVLAKIRRNANIDVAADLLFERLYRKIKLSS